MLHIIKYMRFHKLILIRIKFNSASIYRQVSFMVGFKQ